MYMYNTYDSHEHKDRDMIGCGCVVLDRLEKGGEVMRTEKAGRQAGRQAFYGLLRTQTK